jgi:1-acyl-sn-glycerol-3-phosphate acyltransferase
MKDRIPFPNYQSWMHERCELPKPTIHQRIHTWMNQPRMIIAFEAVLSRFIKWAGWYKGAMKDVFYQMVAYSFRGYLKLFNQLKIVGVDNIPKKGCIFYVNHPGSYDPLILIGAIPKIQMGGFMHWGNGWFAYMLEKIYSISPFRYPKGYMVVEAIIRLILTKNRYFSIWPEGHPHEGPIEIGFSGIVRVYATLNYDKDRIPFVPVLIRGEGCYRQSVQHKSGPIQINFYNPIFIDRSWLRKPEEGGRDPIDIIHYLMMFLAKKNGQTSLASNRRLEHRRTKRMEKKKIESNLSNSNTIK